MVREGEITDPDLVAVVHTCTHEGFFDAETPEPGLHEIQRVVVGEIRKCDRPQSLAAPDDEVPSGPRVICTGDSPSGRCTNTSASPEAVGSRCRLRTPDRPSCAAVAASAYAPRFTIPRPELDVSSRIPDPVTAEIDRHLCRTAAQSPRDRRHQPWIRRRSSACRGARVGTGATRSIRMRSCSSGGKVPDGQVDEHRAALAPARRGAGSW